jgi:hypothetical protein
MSLIDQNKCSIVDDANCTASSDNERYEAITALSEPTRSLTKINSVENHDGCNTFEKMSSRGKISTSVRDTLYDVKMQPEENWSAIYEPMMPFIIYYVTRAQSKHVHRT